jgi:hypothetical protein
MRLLELQETAGVWAKQTPLEPLVEAQNSMQRALIHSWARASRNWWWGWGGGEKTAA